MKFEWCWCDLCKKVYVCCPKCGNNCCNANSGELKGEKCDVCELSYQYQDLAWKTKKVPSKKYVLWKPPKRFKQKTWFELDHGGTDRKKEKKILKKILKG